MIQKWFVGFELVLVMVRGDEIALVMALFGCCCDDIFMIKTVWSFSRLFNSCRSHKKARHGTEKVRTFPGYSRQKVRKYELFYVDTRHPLSRNIATSDRGFEDPWSKSFPRESSCYEYIDVLEELHWEVRSKNWEIVDDDAWQRIQRCEWVFYHL